MMTIQITFNSKENAEKFVEGFEKRFESVCKEFITIENDTICFQCDEDMLMYSNCTFDRVSTYAKTIDVDCMIDDVDTSPKINSHVMQRRHTEMEVKK